MATLELNKTFISPLPPIPRICVSHIKRRIVLPHPRPTRSLICGPPNAVPSCVRRHVQERHSAHAREHRESGTDRAHHTTHGGSSFSLSSRFTRKRASSLESCRMVSLSLAERNSPPDVPLAAGSRRSPPVPRGSSLAEHLGLFHDSRCFLTSLSTLQPSPHSTPPASSPHGSSRHTRPHSPQLASFATPNSVLTPDNNRQRARIAHTRRRKHIHVQTIFPDTSLGVRPISQSLSRTGTSTSIKSVSDGEREKGDWTNLCIQATPFFVAFNPLLNVALAA